MKTWVEINKWFSGDDAAKLCGGASFESSGSRSPGGNSFGGKGIGVKAQVFTDRKRGHDQKGIEGGKKGKSAEYAKKTE